MLAAKHAKLADMEARGVAPRQKKLSKPVSVAKAKKATKVKVF